MIDDLLKISVKYTKRLFGLFVNYFTEISRRVDDAVSDRRLGICTCRESHEIGRLSRFEDGVFYKATAYAVLRRLFLEHPLCVNDVFVDVGCGKGRAVCVAALQPAKQIIGVELQPAHARSARENAARLKGRKAPIEIIEADVTDYISRDGTVFFFYDPFGYETFMAVIGAIRRSIEENPRKIKILYYDARYEDVLSSLPWLKQTPSSEERSPVRAWESVV